MNRRSLPLLWIVLIAAVAILTKSSRHQHSGVQGSFDYYLLPLSWAPNYCAAHPGDNSGECSSGNHTGFVLHGLWPQAESGLSPISCSPARPVAHALVDHMLSYMPSRGLIQHEWAEHGTCSGLTPQEYFSQAEQAFKSVQIPEQYRNLQQKDECYVADLEQAFASANHATREAFRVSCHDGELINVEVCLTKDLHLRPCGSSARECAADRVEMQAPE
jgi:ribonuclease T2